MINRRTCLALLALPFAAAARADDALATAMRETVGDKPVTDGGILLRVPALAENGGQVPLGIVVDAAGNVYFADSVNSRIRRIGTDGVISTASRSTASTSRLTMRGAALAANSSPGCLPPIISR